MTRGKFGAVAVSAAAAVLAVGVGTGLAGGAPTDGATTAATTDTSSALVQLSGDPLATYTKTKPAPGKKVDFSSNQVKSYRAQLSALRNDFKQWLRKNAPAAKVTGEFDIALNAVGVELKGTSLATIAGAPMVKQAQYQGLYRPLGHADPDLGLIDALAAWTASGGTDATAGAGVKVAIVDTGIDADHPCFDDAGYPSQTQLGNTTLTNNKVIAAKVFYNKANVQGLDASAVQDHGTHVAGTVACNLHTAAEVDGVAIPYGVSGVAPRAMLGNYNVFPGNVGNARSEDILNALDAAYADGMDVANMSLGGGAHGIQDLLTVAVDNFDEANMVVAVASGNSGPGLLTVESPGSAARALTAGAASVGHFVGPTLTSGAFSAPIVVGEFATVGAALTADLGVVAGGTNGLDTACAALASGSLTGKVALISRGVCTFSTKIRNAQTAGAVAALVQNNVGGDGIGMAMDGTPAQPTIPAYSISLADGLALQALADPTSVTISVASAYFSTGNSDIMANFSSQGPTDVDRRIKPDLVAPGVNVLSSVTGDCSGDGGTHNECWAFFQGTSMATPHLAGAAAIVRQQHPTWSAAEVRSAIVNTAEEGVLKRSLNPALLETSIYVTGAGRLDLDSAVMSEVLASPVSVSFGTIPSQSGQSRTVAVSVKNLGTSSVTAAISGSSVFSVSGGPIAGGSSGTVWVTMSVPKIGSGAAGIASGKLTLTGDTTAHLVVAGIVS